MFKNKASQTIRVFAFSTSTGLAVTGDAANITCEISKDGGALAALADTNPTEVQDGYYRFDLSQAETNADELEFYPDSATADVVVIGPIKIYTRATTAEIASAVQAVVNQGNGEFAQTISVETAGGDAVQGARVTVIGTTLKQTTPTNGEVVFNLDAGSYTVRVSAPSGYVDPSDTSLTVSADGSTTITLATSGSVTPPDDPSLATLTVKCVDESGAPEADVTINARLVRIPSGGSGLAYKGSKQSATSGANGVATLTVVREATYEVRRGASDQWTSVVIADAATTTITSIVGAP